MDFFKLRNIILDYIPTRLLIYVTVKDIYEYAEFLNHNKIFEIKDIYEYLNHKLNEIDAKS